MKKAIFFSIIIILTVSIPISYSGPSMLGTPGLGDTEEALWLKKKVYDKVSKSKSRTGKAVEKVLKKSGWDKGMRSKRHNPGRFPDPMNQDPTNLINRKITTY